MHVGISKLDSANRIIAMVALPFLAFIVASEAAIGTNSTGGSNEYVVILAMLLTLCSVFAGIGSGYAYFKLTESIAGAIAVLLAYSAVLAYAPRLQVPMFIPVSANVIGSAMSGLGIVTILCADPMLKRAESGLRTSISVAGFLMGMSMTLGDGSIGLVSIAQEAACSVGGFMRESLMWLAVAMAVCAYPVGIGLGIHIGHFHLENRGRLDIL